MFDSLIRVAPLSARRQLRQSVDDRPRGYSIRLAATFMLQRAARAHSRHLSTRLTEIRPLDAPELSFQAVDSMVMDAVFWFGLRGYEGTAAQVWAALCARSQSVLEVGGNVGIFTVVGGMRAGGAYTVVEPIPANAATLRANLARNGLSRVELLEAAVIPGDTEREVSLNVPDEGRAMPVGAHLVDGTVLAARSSLAHVTVPGLPMRALANGRDLIKMDAEGIEAALLLAIRPQLLAQRPTLLIEVLPEATQLAALLSALAVEAGYTIHVLPEWGSDTTVAVDAATFTAGVPRAHNSKDVVLSMGPLPQ